MSSLPRHWPPGVVGCSVRAFAHLAVEGLLRRILVEVACDPPTPAPTPEAVTPTPAASSSASSTP